MLGIFGLKMVAEGSFEILFGAFLSLLGFYVAFRPESARKGIVKTTHKEEGGHRFSAPRRFQAFGVTRRRIYTSDVGTYRYQYNEPGAVATNGLFGFLSSFFGMGGGPIRTPTLVYLFRFPVLVATATSVFTQAIYTTIGTAGHLIDGNVDIVRALLVGVGVVAGAQVGVHLSGLFRSAWIMRLLSLGLLGIGIQLILKGAF